MSEKKALLVVSFGTSYAETRKLTIEAIEQDLKAAFPDRTFYRAWTSRMIKKKLLERDGLQIDDVREALERMVSDGVTDVLIQPTHMLAGVEFEDTIRVIRSFLDSFKMITMGRALIANEDDLRLLTGALEKVFEKEIASGMMVFMGHGSERNAFPVYELLQRQFEQDGHTDVCVGTVEFTPGIEPVLEKIRARRPEKIFLTPLLVVAGDHATNDMSGDDEDSWKNQFAREGAEVTCIVRGLGEYPEIRQLYLEHARTAVPILPA